MKKLFTSLALSLAIGIASVSIAKADTFTFSIGEWLPHLSESLPGGGPDAQKVSSIFEKAGHKVEYKFMKWNRAYELVKQGKIDGSVDWSKNAQRESEVVFANDPIFGTESYAYYSKKKFPNGLGAVSIADLHAKGYKFVGIKGYWYEATFNELGIKAKLVGDSESVWKILKAGRADVFLESGDVAAVEMKKFLGADASMIGREEKPTNVNYYYPIFSKSATKALEIYNANSGK